MIGWVRDQVVCALLGVLCVGMVVSVAGLMLAASPFILAAMFADALRDPDAAPVTLLLVFLVLILAYKAAA